MQPSSFCQRLIDAADQRPGKIATTLLGPGRSETTTSVPCSQIRSSPTGYRGGIGLRRSRSIIGENHPNWAIAYLGIMYRGAVVVLLDPSATAETLATFLKDSQAKLAVSATPRKIRAVSTPWGIRLRFILLQPVTGSNGKNAFSEWTKLPGPRGSTPSTSAAADDMAVLITRPVPPVHRRPCRLLRKYLR